MNAQLPPLPSSVNTTIVVLATFAFVLANGASRAAANAKASKAARDVFTKAQHLAAALQTTMKLREDAIARVDDLGPATPSAVTTMTEDLAVAVEALVDAIEKDKRSAEMLLAAIRAAGKYGTMLEMWKRGWLEAVKNLEGSTVTLIEDLDRIDIRTAVASVSGDISRMMQLSLAEQGLTEWARALPQEDEDLVDIGDAKPVSWIMDHGWIES